MLALSTTIGVLFTLAAFLLMVTHCKLFYGVHSEVVRRNEEWERERKEKKLRDASSHPDSIRAKREELKAIIIR